MTSLKPHLYGQGFAAEYVIADKDYDSEQIITKLEQTGAEAVIPLKGNRKIQCIYEQHLCRERNNIERLFARLKQCRQIATRYEKIARKSLAFLHRAASMILLA